MSLRLLRAGCCVVALGLAAPRASVAGAPPQAEVLAPARAGLDPVPLPSLNVLEPSVAGQLQEARQAFERAAAGAGLARRDLAEAYGALGRVFHAYEFFESAEAAYANASRLAAGDGRWPHLLGYLYQQTGRLEESAVRLTDAQRARPDDVAAALRLGDVHLGLNRLREARAQFERALPTFPAAAHQGLGEVALRERRYEEALGHFTAALERVPQATSLHYSLAMTYRGLGRLQEAQAHLAARGPGGIKAVDPLVEELQGLVRSERLLVIQGRRAYAAGQFQDAADAFGRAAAAAPESIEARVNLGLALAQVGDAGRATGQFEAVLRLDAANLQAHAGLGMVLARLGRDGEAVAHLQTAFEQTPDDGTISRELVGALLRLGRDESAIDVLTKARSASPANEDVLVGLSMLLADRQRYAEALALLDDAHRRFPGRVPTATTLARLLASSPELALRDGRRALALAMEVYASDPAPPHGETVALALAELGRCDEALGWMTRSAAAADRATDIEEAARLRGQTPRYEARPCRPPGR